MGEREKIQAQETCFPFISIAEPGGGDSFCAPAFSGRGEAVFSDGGYGRVYRREKLWRYIPKSGVCAGGKKYRAVYGGMHSASGAGGASGGAYAEPFSKRFADQIGVSVSACHADGDHRSRLENGLLQAGVSKPVSHKDRGVYRSVGECDDGLSGDGCFLLGAGGQLSVEKHRLHGGAMAGGDSVHTQ